MTPKEEREAYRLNLELGFGVEFQLREMGTKLLNTIDEMEKEVERLNKENEALKVTVEMYNQGF